ncbi:MAG: sigma-54 dependent transcriptional regulator [Verrucomicrobiota bacterium]
MKQKLLLIDDEADVHYSFKRVLEKEPIEILTADSPEAGVKIAKAEQPDLIVTDIRMGNRNGLDGLREIRLQNPKQIVIVMTAYGTSQTAIEAMKLGAYDYILKPFDVPQLKALITRALQAAAAQKADTGTYPSKLSAEDLRQTIVGNSPAMQEVYKAIGQVASTPATVLVTGESGTGKELVARAIHQNSPRFKNVYVAMNCAAIPENLLESELFGHEKGAFTGAMNQRIGKFEQCDGGTLFLDEIGEMPLATQAKFLRVLQEGEFTRLGNNESMKTDVRIIAATNKDLVSMVEKKTFREDLYYRLNVVHIHLPPLRERTGDIPLLVEYFMNKIRLKTPNSPSKISPEAMEIIQSHPWPGNVRELENSLQRSMVMASESTILPQHLAKEFSKNTTSIASIPSEGISASNNDLLFDQLFASLRQEGNPHLMETIDKAFALRALKAAENDEVQASKILGVTKAAFKKWI